MYLINRIRSAKTLLAKLDLAATNFKQVFLKLNLKKVACKKIGIRKWAKYSTYAHFLSEFARRYISLVINDIINEGKIYRGIGYQIRVNPRDPKIAVKFIKYYKGSNLLKRDFKMYHIVFVRANVRSELVLKKEYMEKLDKTIDEKKVAVF